MQLEQLLLHISYKSVQGSLIREITDICYHSGKVKRGSLFICLKGFRTDGHRYLSDAVARGAAAVVVEERTDFLPPDGVTVIDVPDTRDALWRLSAAFFDFPAAKLRMVGITGTKGKTTTAYLAAEILREAGHRVGMIGTVAIDDGRTMQPAEHTTPEAYEVQKYLAAMVENGCDCCVMEVSSQGIKMLRTAGIRYDVGVFLNIEPDHIGKGEHASFEEYLSCKRALFDQCEIGIFNRDDAHCAQMSDGHTCRVEYFSTKGISVDTPADYRAECEEFSLRDGKLMTRFFLRYGIEWIPLAIQLPGMFNVSNAVAAAAVALHFRVKPEALRLGLARARVPGRCENISPSEDYVLLIDYAHNEMSLKNLLETLRGFSPKRLVVLFGCGGNRSKLRRSRMGEAAGRLADVTILTSDNPRWEDAEAILDDIETGIRPTGASYVRITDRGEAIAHAVRMARRGDMIVIAGKGHEGYQEIRGVKYPVSDHALAEAAIRQTAGRKNYL